MKLSELPESAFSVYSEKLKQKKKSKPFEIVQNGTGKVSKKKNSFNDAKGLQEIKEIKHILRKLASKEGSINKNIITSISDTHLQLNNSGKGNKTNSAKNHSEKVDQNLLKGISNKLKAKRRRANRKANLKQQPPKNNTEDVVVNNKGIGISKAQNELILHGKQNKKTKLMQSNQSSRPNPTEKCLKTIQHLSFEVEKSPKSKINTTKRANKKHIVEETSSQLKIPSERNNKRSYTQVQKFAISKKGKKSMSNDWTNQENSIQTSKRLFEWLILPIKVKDFMR